MLLDSAPLVALATGTPFWRLFNAVTQLLLRSECRSRIGARGRMGKSALHRSATGRRARFELLKPHKKVQSLEWSAGLPLESRM